MAIGTVKSIASAITEGFKCLANWQKSKAINRLKKAIDAGETYIHAVECFGKYKRMSADKRKVAQRKARARFFKYNQG